MESGNIKLQGRQGTGRGEKYDCLITLFIWEMPQALQYTPLAIIQTSCFICLNIYTKHFFTGTLPKLS